MKKIVLFLAIAGTAALAGCGSKKTENTDQSVPAGMMALDLSKYGKNVIINVPDSTVGPVTVDNSMGEMIRITVGKDFQIDVKEGEGNMEMKKNEDIQKNEVYKFDKFVVDTADAIIYSWHMEGKPAEFGLFATKKVGPATYEIETVAGEIFSETACKKMLEAARSLRAKEMKKPEA